MHCFGLICWLKIQVYCQSYLLPVQLTKVFCYMLPFKQGFRMLLSSICSVFLVLYILFDQVCYMEMVLKFSRHSHSYTPRTNQNRVLKNISCLRLHVWMITLPWSRNLLNRKRIKSLECVTWPLMHLYNRVSRSNQLSWDSTFRIE